MKRMFFTFIAIFLFSCDKTTGPVSPDVTTTEATLKNLHVSIISSDSLIIRNGDSLLVNAMDVVKISVFEEHEDSLVFLKTITPSYKNVGSLLGLEFLLPIKVLYPDYQKTFILQFHMSDDTIIDVKEWVNMYKYLYNNSEKWFDFNIVGSISIYGGETNCPSSSWYPLDFELIGNDIYFTHGGYCAYWGVEKYNINTGEKEDVTFKFNPAIDFTGKVSAPLYAAGFNFALDNNYLFIDYGHGYRGLYRYNMLTDSTEVRIEIPSMTRGIEASNDTLFFIVEKNDLSNIYYLELYSYDGTFLYSLRLPQTKEYGYYCLESYEGILYIWNNDKILRLNLNDLTFLKPLMSPTPYDYGGFDIHDNILYYIVESFVWGEDDIHWLELSELREVE